MVRCQASCAAAASYRGVVSLLNPCQREQRIRCEREEIGERQAPRDIFFDMRRVQTLVIGRHLLGRSELRAE